MDHVIPSYINATGVLLLGLSPLLLAIHKIIRIERERKTREIPSSIQKPKPWWKRLGFDGWYSSD